MADNSQHDSVTGSPVKDGADTRMVLSALNLLRFMVQVEQWVREGNERAKPYLAADAVRFNGGQVSFHRDRFLALVDPKDVFGESNEHL